VVLVVACGGKSAATDGLDRSGDTSVGDTGGDTSPMPDGDPACATPGQIPPLKAVRVTTDTVTKPLFVAQPHGSTDLYVVEKGGKIVIVRNGHVVATPFLDISAELNLPSSDSE